MNLVMDDVVEEFEGESSFCLHAEGGAIRARGGDQPTGSFRIVGMGSRIARRGRADL
jgi:hypothetical protein